MAELRVQVQFDSLTPAHKVPDKQGRTDGRRVKPCLPALTSFIQSIMHPHQSLAEERVPPSSSLKCNPITVCVGENEGKSINSPTKSAQCVKLFLSSMCVAVVKSTHNC